MTKLQKVTANLSKVNKNSAKIWIYQNFFVILQPIL